MPATLICCRPVSGTRGPWAPNRSPVLNGAQDSRERKCTYYSHLARGIVLLWASWADLGRAFGPQTLSTSVGVPSVANCAQCMSSARAARRSRPSQGLSQGGARASVLRALPMWKMATLGRHGEEPENGQPYVGLSCQTRGAEKESWFLARIRSCLDSCLKKVHNGCPTDCLVAQVPTLPRIIPTHSKCQPSGKPWWGIGGRRMGWILQSPCPEGI